MTPSFIQHYEIIRPLGQGGMGKISLARDTRLGRLVAIKQIEVAGGDITRFLSEARATAQINHENIIVIYELGTVDQAPYMVLEYLRGRTFADVLADHQERCKSLASSANINLETMQNEKHDKLKGLPPDRVVELMIPVVRALACLHANGIVHRDLKPSNIMLTDAGVVKVLDFGIAKRLSGPETTPNVDLRPIDVGQLKSPYLTSPGAIVGTLPYMSPEQMQGLEIDQRTDIWASGIIIAELLLGEHPLALVEGSGWFDIADIDVPMPRLCSVCPELGKLARLVDRCLEKNSEKRLATSTELCAELEAIATERRQRDLSDTCPYLGLSVFQESDRQRFFGRSRMVTEAVARVTDEPFVAIVGPSGAGKSSFVRAGLIPGLRDTGIHWEVFSFRPGKHPLGAIAELCLSLDQDDTVRSRELLIEKLFVESGHLGTVLRARARKHRGHVLLFIDQLEEVYTMANERERGAFFALLAGVADEAGSPLRAVATIRLDFLDRLSATQSSISGLSQAMLLLPPMDKRALREALESPLLHVGYKFESEELIERILNELASTSSALPILSFTAAQLWERRDETQRILTTESHTALGGVGGVLARHADVVLSPMAAEDRKLAQTLLLRLVTPEKTRAFCTMNDLRSLSADTQRINRVLGTLIDARLLATTRGDDVDETVELVHESLITNWPTLSRWIEENQVDVAFLARVSKAAREWETAGKTEDLLWRGQAAEAVARWAQVQSTTLAPIEAEYVRAIIDYINRSQRRRRLLVGAAIAGLSVVIAIVSTLALIARQSAILAREEASRADAEALRAREQAQRADKSAADAKHRALIARNSTRMFLARTHDGDPTTAFAFLREMEAPDIPKDWQNMVVSNLQRGVATAVLPVPALPYAAAFGPDDRWVAIVSMDKWIRIWNIGDQHEPILIPTNDDGAVCLSISPDGKLIATGGRDAIIRIFSVNEKDLVKQFRGHQDLINRLAWSPDGTRLVSASNDGTARVWSMAHDHAEKIWKEHQAAVLDVAWEPNGKHIVSASKDGTARVWPVEGDEKSIVFRDHQGPVLACAWRPKGGHIITASEDRSVRMWAADGIGFSRTLFRTNTNITSLDLSPDQRQTIVSLQDGRARIDSIDEEAAAAFIIGALGSEMPQARFSHDGRRVVTTLKDLTVRVWSTEPGAQTLSLQGHKGVVTALSWSPDGTRIASSSADHRALIFPASGFGAPTVLLGSDDRVNDLTWSPDGTRIGTACWDNVARIHAADGQGEAKVLRGHTDKVHTIAWSPDGKTIATGSKDRTIRLWPVNGLSAPIILSGHEGSIRDVSWSPDGRQIVSASLDKTARVFDAKTGETITILRDHTDWVNAAVFHPDGQKILTASNDKTIRMQSIDGTSGSQVLARFSEWVLSVALSPDGKTIVTALNDGTVKLLPIDGSETPWTILTNGSVVFNDARFSPDGKRVAAASDDAGVVVTYRLDAVVRSDAPQLWQASTYCVSPERRASLFGLAEDVVRADYDVCVRKFTK